MYVNLQMIIFFGMTENEVREILRLACDTFGGQGAWATANNVSQGYVSSVMSGRTAPAGKLLAALKIRRVVFYEYTKQKDGKR